MYRHCGNVTQSHTHTYTHTHSHTHTQTHTQGRRAAKTSGASTPIWIPTKIKCNKFIFQNCHDSLKYQPIYIKRQMKMFLIKLFLTAQSFLINFCLLRIELEDFFVFRIFQSHTSGVHRRPGRPGRSLIYAHAHTHTQHTHTQMHTLKKKKHDCLAAYKWGHIL